MGWENHIQRPFMKEYFATWGAVNSAFRQPVTGSPRYATKPRFVPDSLWDWLTNPFLKGEKSEGYYACMRSMLCFGDVARDGVKLYKPDQPTWLGMQSVEMRFPVSEYRQPFNTVVIDLPSPHTVKLPVAVNSKSEAFPTTISTTGHMGEITVDTVVMTMSPPILICALLEQSSNSGHRGFPYTMLQMSLVNDPSGDMEHEFSRAIKEANKGLGIEEFADEEGVGAIIRPCLNACLFLANFGVKRLGRPDELAYTTAERISRNKNVTAEWREENRLKAALIPEVFTIDQHIDLREATTIPTEHGSDGTGGKVSPHWRRAHWASQPHGPQGSLRKLVFRKAAFVNRERFAGTGMDSTTTYRGPG